MKNLQNLFGAKTLNKKEQLVVKGGGTHAVCYYHSDCKPDEVCAGYANGVPGVCVRGEWGDPK